MSVAERSRHRLWLALTVLVSVCALVLASLLASLAARGNMSTLGGCAFTPALALEAAPTVPIAPFSLLIPSSERVTFGGLTFCETPYALRALPNPYDPTYDPAQPSTDGPRDESGVRMTIRDGKEYQFPVGQAQDGLDALATYQRTQDVSQLTLARREAQRLVDTHVTRASTADAWWFPYSFMYEEYGDPHDTDVAPWFSGMAQGMGLALFTQLYALTGDMQWWIAARHTFASFLYPLRPGEPVTAHPWAWHVSDSKLWIEVYPTPNANDHTINPHFAPQFGTFWV